MTAELMGRNAFHNKARNHAVALLVSGLALLPGGAVLAQSAQPGSGSYFDLGTLNLDLGGLAKRLRERIARSGEAARVVGKDDFAQIPAPTVADAVAVEPGVIVQEFFGGNDQPRIQIRGSGLQQSPTERGLLVLRNGMPVNRADGSYIVGLAAPATAEAIEIWRGAAANRLGASVLGGAINFISPRAATDPGSRLSFNAGSFGQYGATGQTAFEGENSGTLMQFESSRKDGFRDINNESRRDFFEVNSEFRHRNGATTQLFFSVTDLDFDVAGPLTKAALAVDPAQNHAGPVVVGPGVIANPGPNVFRDLPRRAATQVLAGARTVFDAGEGRFDLGLSLSHTDDSFRFPISAGERVTDGWDRNLSVRYAFQPETVNGLPKFEVTLNTAFGTADRSYFHNVAGARGPQFGDNELEASTTSVHVGANLPLSDSLVLSPSLSYTHATRKNTDRWALPTRPTVAFNPGAPSVPLPPGAVPAVSNSYDRDFSGWSPRLALTWQPAERQTAWIAYSHGFEPPTHDDLLATTGGTPNSGPGRPNPADPTLVAAAFVVANLRAQEADTFEVGWRGTTGAGFEWDLTAYHSRIDNEILSLRDVTGAPRGSVNADKTVHNGLEAAIGGPLSERLHGRLAWTWQDFRFDNDPVRGNNRLGGAPRHMINVTLAWDATDRLTLHGSARWVPEKTPVDNMNTLFADPYVVADLRAEYRLSDTVILQAGVTNLFDEKYASSTLVVDQARPDQAAFIPGEERAFYFGTAFAF